MLNEAEEPTLKLRSLEEQLVCEETNIERTTSIYEGCLAGKKTREIPRLDKNKSYTASKVNHNKPKNSNGNDVKIEDGEKDP